MFAIVARSATVNASSPGPKYSTNLPTTPVCRSSSVTVRTKSVAVAPSGIRPFSRKPTTCGTSIETGSPSMAASASIPPAPQPRTPRPLTLVVCESVPASVSRDACPSRDSITRPTDPRSAAGLGGRVPGRARVGALLAAGPERFLQEPAQRVRQPLDVLELRDLVARAGDVGGAHVVDSILGPPQRVHRLRPWKLLTR